MARAVLRAFISYSTKDKRVGAEVKRVLGDFGVDSFLAHDDLRVSEEWKERILDELRRCDVFVPLLSKAFRASDWASQETGIASVRRGVLIIPLSIDGTVPFGFISHVQSKKIGSDDIPSEIFRKPLLSRFPRRVIPRLIERVERAWSFRDAEVVVKPLVEIFPLFTKGEANQFAAAAADNRQVWSASLCRSDYIPAFLRLHRKHIRQKTRKALEYQVRYDRPFRE